MDLKKELDELNITIRDLWIKGKYRESIHNSVLGRKLAEESSLPEYEANFNNFLGLNFAALTEYGKSLSSFYKALEMFQKAENPSAIRLLLNNIGLVHLKLNDQEQALAFFQRALAIDCNDDKIHDIKMDDVLVELNIGIVYLQRNELGKALQNFQLSYHIALNSGQTRLAATSLVNIGEVYSLQNNLPQAIDSYAEALRLAEEMADLNIEIPVLNDLGDLYVDIDTDRAELSYKNALNKAENIRNYEYACISLQGLTHLAEKQKDFPKAYQYQKKINALREKVFNEELKTQVAKLSAEYENQQKLMETRNLIEKASRLASIGVMAGGITHEINQPLNAIKISADSIIFWDKRNPDLIPDLFKQEVMNILQGVNRIKDIITHMRSFWKSTPDEKCHQLDINNAVEKGISLMESQLQSHSIFLKKELAKTELLVNANEIMIEQILINLLANAMQALDETDKYIKEITVKTFSDDKYIVLKISDNGKGLPPERDKLFEPLYTTRSDKDGNGLGLAIVKNIINRLKGKITAEDNEKGGAVFLLMLPRCEDMK